MSELTQNHSIFLQILKEELLPAMGCTEPIALAYGAAIAREKLGALPETVQVQVSGNIIKNVKSVIVPNTGGLKGIPAAVTAGLIAGDASRQLEVIAQVTAEQKKEIADFLAAQKITVSMADSPLTFDYWITLRRGSDCVKLRIAKYHTNVVYLEKNGVIECDLPVTDDLETTPTDRSSLSIRKIVEFADTVPLEALKPILEPQVQCNMAIAEEGLKHSYGANIGKVLLESGDSIAIRARAKAAAGSDARMNGCEMPVVIVSGSGNQGLTASVPVIEYAKSLNLGEDRMYRALAVSNLCTIHQKTFIGRLSAFCGAVSAGAGAGAGICYLLGGGYDEIKHTIVNALAFQSGIVCDGAKSSCAAKIGMAVEAGILGYRMYCCGQEFVAGDGIVGNGVERTIQNVGELGRQGMHETDQIILDLMTRE